MLFDEEKRGLLEEAGSASRREEFRALRAASSLPRGAYGDLDRVLAFLTAMSRLFPTPPREPRRITRALL